MDKTEKYDRVLQLEILNALIDAAPNHLSDMQEKQLIAKFQNFDHFVACMLYLEMHDLVSNSFTVIGSLKGKEYLFNSDTCAITQNGIDFLLDDGGLRAILKVHTFKFHRDAVVVLEDLIAISNMSDAEKDKAKSTLGDMPTEALKAVVQTITTAGLTALL